VISLASHDGITNLARESGCAVLARQVVGRQAPEETTATPQAPPPGKQRTKKRAHLGLALLHDRLLSLLHADLDATPFFRAAAADGGFRLAELDPGGLHAAGDQRVPHGMRARRGEFGVVLRIT